MKKRNFAALALLGLSAVLLMGACPSCPGGGYGQNYDLGRGQYGQYGSGGPYAQQGNTRQYNTQRNQGRYTQNYGQSQGSQSWGNLQGVPQELQNFYSSLSSDSKRKFDELDLNGKRNAVNAARQGKLDPNRAVDNVYQQQTGQGGEVQYGPGQKSPNYGPGGQPQPRLGQAMQDEKAQNSEQSGIGPIHCGGTYPNGEGQGQMGGYDQSRGNGPQYPIGAPGFQEQRGYSQMSSDFQAFYSQLSPEGQRKFDSLASDFKAEAMRAAREQNQDPNRAVDEQYNRQIDDNRSLQMNQMDQMQQNRQSNREQYNEKQSSKKFNTSGFGSGNSTNSDNQGRNRSY